MSEIKHYGIPRKSGRYPWGSGENPYQRDHAGAYLEYISEMRKKGLKETEIARSLGMSTTQLRARISMARSDKRADDVAMAIKLKDKGYSNVAAAKRMGIAESTYRNLMNPAIQKRAEATMVTANMIKDSFKDIPYIDIGKGAENHLGITSTRLNTAVAILEEQGYKIGYVRVQQMGTSHQTTVKVLIPPDTDWKELFQNKHKIDFIRDQKSVDGGKSYPKRQDIQNISSDRIKIAYKEDGGADKDGLIEIRRGVEDLDMGKSNYAQVRIAVDGTHYMKGMVVYNDNMPKGVDVIYNTPKPKGTPKMDILKPQSDDPENPFGANIKEGGRRGALNIINEEGDWATWSRNLSSQMLSKQNNSLVQKQLAITKAKSEQELEDILKLTNPAVRQKLLEDYADNADAAAVNLSAAALPRQSNSVLLPYNDIPDNEIYAPNYRNGEKVALIRHPHGGIFEIPVLTVNNKHKSPRENIGNSPDAVGINAKVASQLSGADFDGDTVVVIPTTGKTIKTSSPLKALQGFDPSESYPGYPGMKVMSSSNKQKQMGVVSNLITDMTIKGASESELARAVKHSMVVIDAEKHKLDYKKSYSENQIGELYKKYQNSDRGGSSTIVSKAKSPVYVNERKQGYRIDPKTGERIFTETGRSWVNSKGETIVNKTKTTLMDEAKDAHSLSSGTRVEGYYADYANSMKALANQARKELVQTKPIKQSPTAKEIYKKEVDSLNAKYNLALKNAPVERQAQLVANYIYDTKIKSNPDVDNATKKKIRNQALNEARIRTGAKKPHIEITEKEWEAIQAGAISHTHLKNILNNANTDTVRKLATPKETVTTTPRQLSRIKGMAANGLTQAEIADALGISTSTVAEILNS